MSLVTICLVLIWRREHLVEMESELPVKEKETPLIDRNGYLSDGEETFII
jgi:hypothetical protein